MEQVAPAVSTATQTNPISNVLAGVANVVGEAVKTLEPIATGALTSLASGEPPANALEAAEKAGAEALGLTPERVELAIVLTQTITSLVPGADKSAVLRAVKAAALELAHAV